MRVIQALGKKNAHITYLNRGYLSYKKDTPPLAFDQKHSYEERKRKNLYIKSGFDFGDDDHMTFMGIGLNDESLRRNPGCLDRAM